MVVQSPGTALIPFGVTFLNDVPLSELGELIAELRADLAHAAILERRLAATNLRMRIKMADLRLYLCGVCRYAGCDTLTPCPPLQPLHPSGSINTKPPNVSA